MLADEVDARIRRAARRRGVPLAALVREALENYVPPESGQSNLRFFAIGESDRSDVSRRADEFVRQAIEQDLDTSRRCS